MYLIKISFKRPNQNSLQLHPGTRSMHRGSRLLPRGRRIRSTGCRRRGVLRFSDRKIARIRLLGDTPGPQGCSSVRRTNSGLALISGVKVMSLHMSILTTFNVSINFFGYYLKFYWAQDQTVIAMLRWACPKSLVYTPIAVQGWHF